MTEIDSGSSADREGQRSSLIRTRRRRPSGEPVPLPREPMAGSGKVWIPLAGVIVVVMGLLMSPLTFWLASGEWWDRLDQRLVNSVEGIRTALLTDITRAIDALRDETFLRVLRWTTVVALIVFRRWRHLGVFVGSILVVQLVATSMANRLARARPDGIEILTDWTGFAQPSLPMVAVALTAVGMAYSLIVPGRLRSRALLAIGLAITALGLSRIYLGVDRFTDVLSGGVLGTALPLLAFRIWTPEAVFPVTYRRSKTAHLDIREDHKRAILDALRDQLGLVAVDLELFGLEGSGGSTPLRVRLESSNPDFVFAKLYAQNHLRSDRWYKLGRRLLYGALEDEAAFRSVRKLAEREDYLMRLIADAGVPCPQPLGVVEITPGRQYLTVAEFLPGAKEASEADIDSRVVDSGLRSIRALWDNGLAHRDIKPANLLVRDGQAFLIDVAFGEIRPTPWRQAVDLANMMLTLSLRHSPENVHRAALVYFTEADIGEACAATRGVTMPGELRAHLNTADEDLLAVHRSLAPERDPIRIQRWTRRRLSTLAGTAAMAILSFWLIGQNLSLVRQLL